MDYGQLSQIEKNLYSQKILEFKNKSNLTGVMKDNDNNNMTGMTGTLFQNNFQNTMNNKGTSFYLDQNLEKRVRVMRFLDTHIDNGKTITLKKK